MPRNTLAIAYSKPTFAREPGISIEEYCRKQGFDLIANLADDDTSTHLDLDQRPTGRTLLGTCRRLRVKNIIAPNLYSLFKDSVDAGRQMAKWRKSRITLHLLDLEGHPCVLAGETGLVVAKVVQALGAMERRNIRERIGASQAKRKIAGYVYGPIPFGWDRVGALLQRNESEQLVIDQIDRLRKTGNSYNAIASKLNAERVLTKKNAKWHASTVRNVHCNPVHQRAAAMGWEPSRNRVNEDGNRNTRNPSEAASREVHQEGGVPSDQLREPTVQERKPRSTEAAPAADSILPQPNPKPSKLVLKPSELVVRVGPLRQIRSSLPKQGG